MFQVLIDFAARGVSRVGSKSHGGGGDGIGVHYPEFKS